MQVVFPVMARAATSAAIVEMVELVEEVPEDPSGSGHDGVFNSLTVHDEGSGMRWGAKGLGSFEGSDRVHCSLLGDPGLQPSAP